MALGSSFTEFQDGKAWIQINWDDVALEVVSVVYQNATQYRATVNVSQANRSDQFIVLPGAGVPNPITQPIPHNRYTYSMGSRGGMVQDFAYSVTFAP